MSVQLNEKIVYNRNICELASNPFEQYLNKFNPTINFFIRQTNCSRGYIGEWIIINNKLYCSQIKGTIENEKQIDINYFFKTEQEKFANWFSGDLKIVKGNVIIYNYGFDSIYEDEIILTINKGIVTDTKIINNRNKTKEELKMKEMIDLIIRNNDINVP